MLTSFINQRGTLTSYSRYGWQMNAKMPNPRRYGASIATRGGLAGFSVNQFGINVEFTGSIVATFT